MASALGTRSGAAPAVPERSGIRAALAATLAAAAFFTAWGAIHYGFYARDQIVDTPVYEHYGDAIRAGEVPYRDFQVEYPPAALPVFVIPSLGASAGDLGAYRRIFEALMSACGAAAAALVALVLVRDGASPLRLVAGVGLAALAPLALGSVVLSRFDLWPALLTVAALAALTSRRLRLGSGVLGLAAAAKVYPAVMLPLALAYAWRERGRGEAIRCGATFAAVAAACLVPFLALSPGGVWHSVVRQTTRPLQIESLGSGFLLAAHQVAGVGLTMQSSHGSQNLAGTSPDAIGVVQSVLVIAALLGVWVSFARRIDGERLVRGSAAAVAAFTAFGKVLSPQFLIWLVPLVPLVRGRRGLAAGALLLVAMILTQLWFPYRYWNLALDFDPRASWLVLARDLLLVALVAVLALPRGIGQKRAEVR
jgi:hypothetical protein